MATLVNAQLYNEIAERELVKKLRHQGTFMSTIPTKNKWVSNDVIKIPVQGADPQVLINNNTYPIAVNKRDDSHIILGLNKYETENTSVSIKEINELPYEKTSDVQMQHRETLEETTMMHTLHGVAPLDSTNYPVLVTTGPDDGTGRKMLVTKDLVKLREQFKRTWRIGTKIVLVLSPEHVSDLLVEDKQFNIHYQNHKDAKIADMYMGFEVYETTYSPLFDTTGGAKLAFGSISSGSVMTVAFWKNATAKATGTAIRHLSDMRQDTRNRQTEIGFTLFHIGVAWQDRGIGALISG